MQQAAGPPEGGLPRPATVPADRAPPPGTRGEAGVGRAGFERARRPDHPGRGRPPAARADARRPAALHHHRPRAGRDRRHQPARRAGERLRGHPPAAQRPGRHSRAAWPTFSCSSCRWRLAVLIAVNGGWRRLAEAVVTAGVVIGFVAAANAVLRLDAFSLLYNGLVAAPRSGVRPAAVRRLPGRAGGLHHRDRAGQPAPVALRHLGRDRLLLADHPGRHADHRAGPDHDDADRVDDRLGPAVRGRHRVRAAVGPEDRDRADRRWQRRSRPSAGSWTPARRTGATWSPPPTARIWT